MLRAVVVALLAAAPLVAVVGPEASPASAAVRAVGEIGALVAPAAPVNVVADPLDGSARVSFELPAESEAATSFEVTPSVGGAPVSGPASPIVVPGLTNGVAVSFTVTATNDTGTSSPSNPSNEVTPTALPSTTPAITEPVAAASVSGVVHITATTTAPAVRFAAAGVDLGPPVVAALGSAETDWTSWGFANGTQTISAYDCNTTDPETCSVTPASVDVTLANELPVVTSPTEGQLVSATMPLHATAPGGGIELQIDGTLEAFDASAPYEQTAALDGLADGAHVARAVSCDVTGTRCAGPVSAEVTFQVLSLHPVITSRAPTPFSPNGDGVKDAVTVNLTLPDTETAEWRVFNDADETVRGPISMGALTTGSHPFSWNGKDTAGDRVPDGTYRIVVTTSRQETGVLLRGSVETTVVVDTRAPTFSNVTGNGGTFYPGGGGSPTKFTAGATFTERVMLRMTVRKTSGALIRRPYGNRGPGAATIQWTGRNTLDQWAPSGTYHWWLKATDVAGNSRTVGKFTAKMVRYVSRTSTHTLPGGAYASLGANQSSCSYISRADSDFATGLWLLNDCPTSSGPNLVQANYAVIVPDAHRYDSVTVAMAGYTINHPSEIYALVVKPSGAPTLVGSGNAPTANSWFSFGSRSAAGYVNQVGRLRFSVGVSNAFGAPSDLDINSVQIKVRYTVIA